MRGGYVAGSIGINRHDMMRRETGCQIEALVVSNHRRNKLLRRAFDSPDLIPGFRIEADHLFAARHHHLGSPGDVANDGRAVAANLVSAWRFPDGLSIRAIERHNVGFSVVISVNDQKVVENYRRAAEPMSADKVANSDMPEFIAAEIERGDEDLPRRDIAFTAHVGGRDFVAINDQKRNIDRLAIGRGSSGSVAV